MFQYTEYARIRILVILYNSSTKNFKNIASNTVSSKTVPLKPAHHSVTQFPGHFQTFAPIWHSLEFQLFPAFNDHLAVRVAAAHSLVEVLGKPWIKVLNSRFAVGLACSKCHYLRIKSHFHCPVECGTLGYLPHGPVIALFCGLGLDLRSNENCHNDPECLVDIPGIACVS